MFVLNGRVRFSDGVRCKGCYSTISVAHSIAVFPSGGEWRGSKDFTFVVNPWTITPEHRFFLCSRRPHVVDHPDSADFVYAAAIFGDNGQVDGRLVTATNVAQRPALLMKHLTSSYK